MFQIEQKLLTYVRTCDKFREMVQAQIGPESRFGSLENINCHGHE